MKKILLLFLLLSCHAIAQDEINMKDTLNHFDSKKIQQSIGLPSFFGCQLGLKADYLLHHFLESELVPEGNIMLRCDIGLLVNNYNHIRSDLGKFSYQVNFGVLIALFGKEFEYEF